MSKKQKQCPGRDTFHRMNYLYQASELMTGRNDFLSSYYGHQCRAIGKKSVLKMEPAVKRTLCKKCSVFLKLEKTANIDVEEGGMKVCTMICRKCGFSKRYHLDQKYSMWLDNPASVAESMNFSADQPTNSLKENNHKSSENESKQNLSKKLKTEPLEDDKNRKNTSDCKSLLHL